MGGIMERELKRRRWIVHKKIQGWDEKDIAAALRISVRTVRRWWKVYREKGWSGLEIKSRKPKITHKTSKKIIDEIIRLREERNWGPNKIEAYLKNKQDKVPSVGHNTIYRIICNAGLNNALERKRRTWGKKRFERKYSNSLWQADFKLTEEDLWMVSYLDDHSRFITGSEKFNDPTTKNALEVLETSIDKYGRPKQILTDRGTQFYPARKKENKETMSRFTRYCKDLDIEHIVASKRRPTTIGKVEAFHKAYVFEAWMFDDHKDFVHYWNYERPHQGIKYMYPAEIYFKDLNRTDVMG